LGFLSLVRLSKYLALLVFIFLLFIQLIKASKQKIIPQKIWVQFHQHVDVQLLRVQIPRAQKDSQVVSVFLRFWDLQAQKLLMECW